MGAKDAGPGLSARGVTFAGHTFAAWTRADPGVVWTALTDPGQTAAFLYGLAADSTWIPGSPLRFSGGGVQVSGRVLCVQRPERLSYVLQALVDPGSLAQRADQPPSRTYEEPLANDAGAEHR
jgi:hypothetical protein